MPDLPGWAQHTVVIDDLRRLRGPRTGRFALPASIDSSVRPMYDFADPWARQLAYRVVLTEANTQEDLAAWLDRETLLALWFDLHVPWYVRQAWQDAHAALAVIGGAPHVPPVR